MRLKQFMKLCRPLTQHQAWDILCGKGFPVSPLAYATSTSFTRGLFLAVFDELEKVRVHACASACDEE